MINNYVLDQVSEKRKLLNTILKSKKRCFGHILKGKSFVKEAFEGRMKGMRGRRKPCVMMLDDMKADESYEKIKHRTMDIECWTNSKFFKLKFKEAYISIRILLKKNRPNVF